jgi:hypothetical protein
MFARWSTLIASGLVVAAVAAPTAAAGSPLAAKTEAAGYTAISQYLVRHAATPDTAELAARTEAKGYRALVRYREQLAASPAAASSPSSSFDWGDAFVGAAVTIGVFLLGAAAAIVARRRHWLARARS